MAGMNLPKVQYDLIRLQGGLDQVTPTLSLRPGTVRRAANFECAVTGGYTRIAGYERFDGRPNPSDAQYIILSGTQMSPVSVGSTVTGGSSGATGKVIAVLTGKIVLTRQTGTFTAGEWLTVSGTMVMSSIEIVGVAADGADDANYKSLAADDYRTDIQAVPGSGPVRGVAYFKGDVYAWRNNSTGTALKMYKATSSGWSIVSAYNGLPNGRVESVVANFGGGQFNSKLYFCDGVNPAFEFDGTALVQINTGMTPNVPTKIAAHKQHLFLAFGHSLQFSAIGNPLSWTPVLGAGEIAMNDTITNLILLPGDQSSGAMAVYTESDTSVLYGSSEADFKLSNYNINTGAMPYTAQNMDQTYALAQNGVMGMSTTLNYGNFLSASLTMNIRPFIQARRKIATASLVNREKGQYRIFFSDGYGLYLTISNNNFMGAMPVQFPNPVTCTVSGGSSDGPEVSFFGSTNGFVYRLDAGTSFDGAEIQSNITLVYNSINSPRILKRYRRASVELTGDSYAEFGFSYDLGYRTQELDQPSDDSYSNDLRPSFWDSFNWDNFVWDGRDISPSEVEVTGTAENIAVRISSVSKLLEPFTVNSIIIHYTMRRGIR